MSVYRCVGSVSDIYQGGKGLIRPGGSLSFELSGIESHRDAVTMARKVIADAFEVTFTEVFDLKITEIGG